MWLRQRFLPVTWAHLTWWGAIPRWYLLLTGFPHCHFYAWGFCMILYHTVAYCVKMIDGKHCKRVSQAFGNSVVVVQSLFFLFFFRSFLAAEDPLTQGCCTGQLGESLFNWRDWWQDQAPWPMLQDEMTRREVSTAAKKTWKTGRLFGGGEHACKILDKDLCPWPAVCNWSVYLCNGVVGMFPLNGMKQWYRR